MRRAKGVKRPSSRFKAFGAARWSPSHVAQDPNRDREASRSRRATYNPRPGAQTRKCRISAPKRVSPEDVAERSRTPGRERPARRADPAAGRNRLRRQGYRGRPAARRRRRFPNAGPAWGPIAPPRRRRGQITAKRRRFAPARDSAPALTPGVPSPRACGLPISHEIRVLYGARRLLGIACRRRPLSFAAASRRLRTRSA